MEGREERGRQIQRLAALADAVRRKLYELVISSEPKDLSRDEAADALGIRRGLAAFHLDKLVDAGLLQTQYRRPPGVGGPGAGRPTKFYRRSDNEFDVSIPSRRYDLMGAFLARAVENGRTGTAEPARSAARSFGHDLGVQARSQSGPRASDERILNSLAGVLAENGFEPLRTDRHTIVLRNCPFHLLSESYRDTVCDINLALHRGVVEGVGIKGLRADKASPDGRCCVMYRAS